MGLAVVVVVRVVVVTEEGKRVVRAFVGASVNTTVAMGDIVSPYVGISDVVGTVMGGGVIGDVVDIVGESVSTIGTGLVIAGETVAGGMTTSLGVCNGITNAVGAWDVVGANDVASICRIAPFGLTYVSAIGTAGEGIV